MNESSRQRPVVVYGPAGCGKSRAAESLMMRFGCSGLQDEWDGVSPLDSGVLALTNVPPPYYGVDAQVVLFESCEAA